MRGNNGDALWPTDANQGPQLPSVEGIEPLLSCCCQAPSATVVQQNWDDQGIVQAEPNPLADLFAATPEREHGLICC